ncbi:MAG: hypothetical protein M3464_19110 [Chloroflexota bacterium]|nr:hypothetical protein [Chloroflexota bacterium]
MRFPSSPDRNRLIIDTTATRIGVTRLCEKPVRVPLTVIGFGRLVGIGSGLSLAIMLILLVVPVVSERDGVLGPTAAVAAVQEAATPGAVDADECRVAPLSTEELIALSETTGATVSIALGTPAATPEPPAGGTPADLAIVDEVTATARELVACVNAGKLPRLMALYTVSYRISFWGGVGSAEEVTRLASPTPLLPPGQQAKLVSVEDVRELPDGRVSAMTQIDDRRALMVFAEVDDRYLLDYSYELPQHSTPTP